VYYYMKNKEKTEDLINYMLNLCNKIYYLKDRFGNSYDDFLTDDAYQLAVCMVIIDFGESAKNLAKEIEDENPQFPWHDVIGMRNIFAHNYMGIDFDEVWTVIQDDLPYLEKLLKEMLSKIQNN